MEPTQREKLIALAEKQVIMRQRYGRQARNELTDEQIGDVCEALLGIIEANDKLAAMLSERSDELQKVKQQRDAANGKLSALKRQQSKGGNE